jgi:hypothetical protein
MILYQARQLHRFHYMTMSNHGVDAELVCDRWLLNAIFTASEFENRMSLSWARIASTV